MNTHLSVERTPEKSTPDNIKVLRALHDFVNISCTYIALEAKILIICFEYLVIRYKQTVIELLPVLKSSRVPTFKTPNHLTNKKKS